MNITNIASTLWFVKNMKIAYFTEFEKAKKVTLYSLWLIIYNLSHILPASKGHLQKQPENLNSHLRDRV